MTAWRIGLLLGGEASERPVSVVSGLAVGDALLRRGHTVLFCDPTTGVKIGKPPGAKTSGLESLLESTTPSLERIPESLRGLGADAIDVVANLIHGGAGEGGKVQAVLELLGLPFFGSGSQASATAMDKVVAKAILGSIGIPVAPHVLWAEDSACDETLAPPSTAALDRLGGYPVVVKPIAEGSTVGITIVRDPDGWREAFRAGAAYRDRRRGLMVERYVPGRELTVAVIPGLELPVVEIQPRTGFYDFERKYGEGQTDYVVPAEIPGAVAANLSRWSKEAFDFFGCDDLARVDYRLGPDGEIACLEINTIPGMTPTSLVPMAARAVGIEFDELMERFCGMAIDRVDRQIG